MQNPRNARREGCTLAIREPSVRKCFIGVMTTPAECRRRFRGRRRTRRIDGTLPATAVTSPELGSEPVLVQQPAETVNPLDTLLTFELLHAQVGDRRFEVDAAVWALPVLVSDELLQYALGMAFTADEHPVQALGPGCEHEPFRESGTPIARGGPASVTVTATDSNGASASVMFNWQVNSATQSPSITSASSTSFVVGTAGSFTVTTTGNPAPAITESGKLPSGVTFTDNGNGTATISGTPKTGTKGTYPITITASNGVSPNATQSFTLTVKYPTTLSVLIAPSPDKVASALIVAAVLSADDSGGTVSFSVSFDGGPSSPIASCQNKPVYLVVSDCIYTPTSQGTYTISASFSGDTSFAPSSGSASVKTLLPTTLALSFSASPHKGSALVVSAKVSPTPSSGTVAFAAQAPNGQKVSLPASCSSAALSAGVANCSFTPSQDGTYTVSAVYSGNSVYAPSSNNATVKVTG
jgi:hypothetical protein